MKNRSICLLIATASGVLLTGCCASRHTEQWEYTVLGPAANPRSTQDETAYLNEKSKEGWIFIQKDSAGKYIFRRPSK